MTNIEVIGSTIKVQNEEKTVFYPKGSLYAFANEGEQQAVSMRLMASRKNVHTFLYSDTNIQGGSASEVVEKLNEIL